MNFIQLLLLALFCAALSPTYAAPLQASVELLLPVQAAEVQGLHTGGISGVPMQVNHAQIKALPPGTELNLTLPNLRQYSVIFDSIQTHDANSYTWVGHLKGYGENYRVIITVNSQSGSFGTLLTPEGEFLIKSGRGGTLLFDVKETGLTPYEPVGDDFLAPPASALSIKDGFWAMAQEPITSEAAPTPVSTIDVMVIYTASLVTKLGSTSAVQNRINHLIGVANQAFIDSEVAMTLRLVHSEQVTYNDEVDQGVSLKAITDGTGVFSHVAGLRNAKGADLVVLLHPFKKVNQSCGIAWLGGFNGAPISQSADRGYSVVADGEDEASGGFYCADYTFIHELGHNMGSKHDRRTDTSSDTGAYPYSFGYGVDNGFVSIMAYSSSYTNSPTVGKFSNPNLNNCIGLACGISSNFSNSADNAQSLNNVRQAVAAFYFSTSTEITAPAALAASNVGNTGFTASWSSVSGVTGYRLDVATNNSFSNFVSGYQNRDVGNVLNLSVTGLSAGTTYYYRVRAYDNGGNHSGYSNIINAVTLIQDSHLPGKPETLSPSGTIYTNQPAYIWNAVSGAQWYWLYVYDYDAGIQKVFERYAAAETNCADGTGTCSITPSTALAYGSSVSWNVLGENLAGFGEWSDWRNFLVDQLQLDTTAPTVPSISSAIAISLNQIDLSWSASSDTGGSGLAGYKIERCTGNSCSNYSEMGITTSTSYSNTGLSAGTSYRYRVRAYDNAGNHSDYSASVTIATQSPPPSAPIFVTVNQTASISISNISIYGNSGNETVILADGVNQITIDQNIEQVQLPSAFSQYTFRKTGNRLAIYDTTGQTLIARFPVQGDADGTLVKFTDVTLSAKLTAGEIHIE